MKLPTAINNQIDAEIDPAFAKRAQFIFCIVQRLKPRKVLDAGCGRGFYVNSLTHFPFIKEIHGIDLSTKYLSQTKKIKDKRVQTQVGNIYKLPFSNNYFDLVICSEILEHLEHENKAIQEINRVLKRKGHLIASVPNTNFPTLWDPVNRFLMMFGTHIPKNIWWLAGIWADHLRLYTPTSFRKLIFKNNFKIIEQKSFTHYCWPFSHFLLYGIGKNIVERLGMKQFDRFSSEYKPASSFLAKIIAFPSRFDPQDMSGESSVDLAIFAQKK